MAAKLEDLVYSTLACLGDHECCILLEDAAVTLLIGLAKIASRYRLPDSQMVEFPGMSLHGYNQIPEALPIGKLTEDHCKQLIPTGIALDILVAFILGNDTIEFTSVKKLD